MSASTMTSAVATVALPQIETPLLAVALAQGADVPASIAALDKAAGGLLARAITSGDFKGKRDETSLLYPPAGKPQRILLVGVGKASEVTRNAMRRAAAVAARRARALGATRFHFAVATEARNAVSARDLGQVVVEGAGQGAWAFTELKRTNEDAKPDVEAVTIVVAAAEAKETEAGRRIGDAVAAGHRLARYLQVQPGNVCTPSYLADQARQLAQRHGFGITVLDRAAMKAEGMGALLAVAQGTQEEPRFIVLEYQGAGGTGAGGAAPIALIGKGVTFDSGGISIKPAQSMEDMKYDMSGAAAVLGAFEVLGALRPNANVVGLIPATENRPAGTAVKPGDVVKSHLGKTIEIINTDAEGRLILCDALSYARRFKPAAVIDAATLTGAVVVALGHVAIGGMGDEQPRPATGTEDSGQGSDTRRPVPVQDRDPGALE